jgi:hypothetical protein
MKKIGSLFSAWIFIFSFSALARSNTTVTLTTDRDEIGKGDTFSLGVTIVTDGDDIGEPDLRGKLGPFELVQQAGVSHQDMVSLQPGPGGFQAVSRSKKIYEYLLAANSEGSFTIPAIPVVVDGDTFFSRPIRVVVLKEGSGAAQRNPAYPPGFDDEEDPTIQMFKQMLRQRPQLPAAPTFSNRPLNPKEAFSVVVEVDKDNVYEGEQITVSWYIYTRGVMTTAPDRLKFPDLKGFWKEIVEEVPALNFTQEIVNGIGYRKALLASHALFPIKPGIAVIDEFRLRATIQMPAGQFGSIGFGQPFTATKTSERVKVNVKPIPVDGRPEDFAGAIGDFDVSAQIEGQSFPAGQPFSLRVRFEGKGNAKPIELPQLNLPGTVEIYDTRAESKYFRNGRSYKEFEVLLIPREPGPLKIPELSFSMFDPRLGKYVTRTTSAMDVTITEGKGGTINSERVKPNEVGGSGSTAVRTDVLPDILLSYSSPSSVSMVSGPFVWGLIYLGVIASLLVRARTLFGWGRKKKDLRKIVGRRMKRSRELAGKGDWRGAGTELTNSMYAILGELTTGRKVHTEISKLLEEIPPSVRRELGTEIQRVIEFCQILSFAPEEVVGKYKESAALEKSIADCEQLLLRSVELSSEEEQ